MKVVISIEEQELRTQAAVLKIVGSTHEKPLIASAATEAASALDILAGHMNTAETEQLTAEATSIADRLAIKQAPGSSPGTLG